VTANLQGLSGEANLLMSDLGWHEGIDLQTKPFGRGTVATLEATTHLSGPADQSEVVDLYEEAFGRSFFVRQWEGGMWDERLVERRPYAVYALAHADTSDSARVELRVMADVNGKCGAAQAVHALNVMCGLEECLGIPDVLPVV